jgi:hypothetical protein
MHNFNIRALFGVIGAAYHPAPVKKKRKRHQTENQTENVSPMSPIRASPLPSQIAYVAR